MLRQGSGSLSMARVRLRIRACSLAHLDQWHLRDRVEEMQPDESSRVSEVDGQRLECQARGVGGKDRPVFHARLDGRVQVAFGRCVLEDRLDHEVRAFDAVSWHVALQSRHLFCRLAGHATALFKECPRVIERRLHGVRVPVLQRDREAAQRTPGGDVAAHDPRAHHVHVAAGR
jgi:hypothetical protein